MSRLSYVSGPGARPAKSLAFISINSRFLAKYVA